MTRAAITAVGRFVPEGRLTNADLERMVETNDEWIRTRTGIHERRILWDRDKASAFMATAAARRALASRDLDPSEVEAIIVATVTPDMTCPSTACLVAAGLEAPNAWGFDLLAACSGFLFALSTGARFIESGKHRRVLVIGVDKMSSVIDYTDRNTCILFGDGAAAVLLEPGDEFGLIDSIERVDGRYGDLLNIPASGSLRPATHETVDERRHYLRQEGRQVYKFAVEGMSGVTAEIMERNGLSGDDVRYLVPHQANARIIDAVARRAGIPAERVMVNIQRYGNTTAGTIPLCLSDWEHELQPGDNLILAAFGGGFTWGAAYLKWAYDGSARPRPETFEEQDAAAETPA